jgi:endo-1,4-beta-xylanase
MASWSRSPAFDYDETTTASRATSLDATDVDEDGTEDDRGGGVVAFGMTSSSSSTKSNVPLRLQAATACKGIDIGAAVMPKLLSTPDVEDYDASDELQDVVASMETNYARVLRQEFNAVVVEHHLKWAPLCVSEPGPLPGGKASDRLGRYDFHHADAVVDWALTHNMKVKGHVLVWAVTSPTKLLEEMAPAAVREQLKRHIFTVMGYYRGRIKVWDVVNESLAPDGTLADNVFMRKLGPTYIEDSFRWAHEADPSATLLYNDNKVEGIGTPKGDAFYNLLADLVAKGVPVHGCGLQAHFNAAGVGLNRPPTPRMVKQQIHRLGLLGLTVNFSEMDVRVSKLPAELRASAQRQIYYDLIAAALSEPAFDGVWLWGFTDRHTWVSSFYYDDEPLIFDEEYRRKEAYYGVRDAIASLCPGGRVGGDGVLLHADVDVDGNPWGHLWMQREATELLSETISNNVVGDARPDWEQVPMDEPDDNDDDDDKEFDVVVQNTSELSVSPPTEISTEYSHADGWS